MSIPRLRRLSRGAARLAAALALSALILPFESDPADAGRFKVRVRSGSGSSSSSSSADKTEAPRFRVPIRTRSSSSSDEKDDPNERGRPRPVGAAAAAAERARAALASEGVTRRPRVGLPSAVEAQPAPGSKTQSYANGITCVAGC
jgi:hypothetical protein